MDTKEASVVPEYLPYKDDPKYLIYNDGRVYSLKTDKFLISRLYGAYYKIFIYINSKRNNISVHKLVAEMFITNDDPVNKIEVNHMDLDTTNNNYTNLEWITRSDNVIHAIKNGKCFKGKKVLKCDMNGNIIKKYDSVRDAENDCGWNRVTLWKVLNGNNILKDKSTGIDYIWKYKEPSLKCDCPEDAVPIKGNENYFITKNAIIWSSLYRSLVIPRKLPAGYMSVKLTTEGKRNQYHVQVLVARTFIGDKPEGMTINHINGHKDDNRLENLQYNTWSEKAYLDIENGIREVKGIQMICPYTHKVVKEFSSRRKASEYLKCHYNIVVRAINNDFLCGGYQLIVKGSEAKDLRIRIRNILQVDKDGNNVDAFDSAEEAGRITKYYAASIRKACKSGELYKEFYWEYIYILGFDLKSKAVPPPEEYVFDLAEDDISDEE